MSELGKKHFNTIDLLRGIASLGVCYVHLAEGVPNYLDKENAFLKIAHFGQLGIDIFFLISGFVIPFSLYKYNYKAVNFFKFLCKRMMRIDPPYYISILLVLLSLYLTSLHPMARGSYTYDLAAIALHVGYLVDLFGKFWVNPVYWTLAIEFQFYILLILLFPLFLSNKWYCRITLFVLILSPIILKFFFVYFQTTSTVFNFIFHFSLGITLFLFITKKMEKVEAIVFSLLSLLLVYYQFGVLNFSVLLVTTGLILFTDINSRLTKFLGNISYSLYLIHAIIGTKILSISTLFLFNPDMRVMFLFAVFLFTIFCSYLYYRLVEVPFLKLSRKFNT